MAINAQTVRQIYDGSDAEATKALYQRLSLLGPIGVIAVNLLRAQKSSARAKVYRGGVAGHGSFRSMAYDRKEWSLGNLCTVLVQSAAALELTFGWERDEATPGFSWVLYVDLPTGQVSFHAPARGAGPDYEGVWDGVRDASAGRIVRWCQQLLDAQRPVVVPAASDALAKFRALGQVTPHGIEQIAKDAAVDQDLWCPRCAVWWRDRIECPSCGTRLVYKARPGAAVR